MKQYHVSSRSILVGLLVAISLSVIVVGCLKQQQDRNPVTSPTTQSSPVTYLNMAKALSAQAKTTGLTITAIAALAPDK